MYFLHNEVIILFVYILAKFVISVSERPSIVAVSNKKEKSLALSSDTDIVNTSSRDVPLVNSNNEFIKYRLGILKLQCHEELLEECRKLALEQNIALSAVMNLSAINSMSEALPNSKAEFMKIQHVTEANYNKYGEKLLKITQKYKEKLNNIQKSNMNGGRSPVKSPIVPQRGTKRKSTTKRTRGVKR